MKKLLLAAFGLLTAACTFAAVPVNRYAKQVPITDETCTRNNPTGPAGVNNRIWTNDTDPQIYQWCTSVSDGYSANDQNTLVGAFIRVPGDANQNQYFLRSDNREHYYLIYEVHNSNTEWRLESVQFNASLENAEAEGENSFTMPDGTVHTLTGETQAITYENASGAEKIVIDVNFGSSSRIVFRDIVVTVSRALPPYHTQTINEFNNFTAANFSRWTGNIILTNDASDVAETISPLQVSAVTADEGNRIFYDKSEIEYLVYAGATVHVNNNSGSGTNATQKYVFVDWNNDGWFGPENVSAANQFIYGTATDGHAASEIREGSELVDYTSLQIGSTWHHKAPNTTQHHAYNKEMTFTVPESTQPGTYRVRYKYEWNGWDPNRFAQQSGIVVDFTLKVVTFEQMYAILIDRLLEEHGITDYEYTVPQGMASHQDVLDRVAEFDIPFELDALNGRTVLIGNVAGAGVVDLVNGAVSCTAGNAPLSAAWAVAVADNKIAFANAVSGLKLNNAAVSDAEATQWTVTPVSLGSSQVTIANADGSKLTVVDGELTLAAEGGDNVWTVTEVSADDQARWHTAANAATEAYNTAYTLGNEPGKYVVAGVSTEDYVSVRDAKTAFNAAYAEGIFDYAAAASLTAASPAQLSLFDLNALNAPALVTLSYSGWSTQNKVLASNVEFGGNQMLTTGNEGSIFVLDNGCLYGLENGRAIIAGESAPYVHYDDDYATNEASVLTFGEVSGAVASGKYYIKSGSTKTFGASSGNGVHRIPFDNQANIPAQNFGYFITYVEELTVACGGDKVYRLPVAAELSRIDDDVRVFVVEVSGDEITTTQVSVGAAAAVYPAGTCFMMRGNGNTVFAAHNGEIAEGTYANSVAGHHKAHAYTAPENMVGLVLKVSAAEPEQPEVPAEMPVRRASGAESETMAMVAVSASDKMEAHNAVLEVPVAGNMKEGATANVILGGKISTAITEVTMDANGGNAAVYDLQGRRLAAPVKGINIIGGRKVLVR